MNTETTPNSAWTIVYTICVTAVYGFATLVSGIGLCYALFVLMAAFSIFGSVGLAAFVLVFVVINAAYLWWSSRWLWSRYRRDWMYQRDRWVPIAVSLPLLIGLLAFFVDFLQDY
jgi:hypothetical protein